MIRHFHKSYCLSDFLFLSRLFEIRSHNSLFAFTNFHFLDYKNFHNSLFKFSIALFNFLKIHSHHFLFPSYNFPEIYCYCSHFVCPNFYSHLLNIVLLVLTILQNSASSFHWLSSSIFSCSSFVPHCNTSSYLHYMMFQTIQTIYFL